MDRIDKANSGQISEPLNGKPNEPHETISKIGKKLLCSEVTTSTKPLQNATFPPIPGQIELDPITITKTITQSSSPNNTDSESSRSTSLTPHRPSNPQRSFPSTRNRFIKNKEINNSPNTVPEDESGKETNKSFSTLTRSTKNSSPSSELTPSPPPFEIRGKEPNESPSTITEDDSGTKSLKTPTSPPTPIRSHQFPSTISREATPLLSEKEKLYKSLGIDQLPKAAQEAITTFYEDKKETTLTLSGLKLTKLPECLFTHPEFNRIELLLLDSNDFIEFPVELTSLSNLRAVNLTNNGITSIPKEFQHPKLEWLHLSGNPIRNPIIDHSKLPNLKGISLDISSPSLGEINLDNLWEFPVAAQEKIVAYLDINNRDKSSLDLSNCALESVPKGIFSQPPFLEKLENINLSGNKFKEFPAKFLSLPNLKELNLSHNQIEEFDTRNLTHPNLETLNISENPIDSGITMYAKNPTYFKGSPTLPHNFPKLKSFIISYYNRET